MRPQRGASEARGKAPEGARRMGQGSQLSAHPGGWHADNSAQAGKQWAAVMSFEYAVVSKIPHRRQGVAVHAGHFTIGNPR